MNTIKKIVAACLIGAVAFSLNAQPDPGATIDPETGDLILSDGTRIAVPAGEVVDGNLVVNDQTIVAPTATVNLNGSITLGDGTTLEVPQLPVGGPFIISWFGNDLLDFDAGKPADQNQWYFSFRFKNLFHFAANNWFYSLELDAVIYINPNSGAGNLDDGVWVYTPDLFNGQTVGTWVYIAGSNGFHDLRDQNEDGILEIADADAGAQSVNGFLYVKTPTGYPTTEQGFFFFGEFPDGNFIWRAGDVANAQKLREPTL